MLCSTNAARVFSIASLYSAIVWSNSAKRVALSFSVCIKSLYIFFASSGFWNEFSIGLPFSSNFFKKVSALLICFPFLVFIPDFTTTSSWYVVNNSYFPVSLTLPCFRISLRSLLNLFASSCCCFNLFSNSWNFLEVLVVTFATFSKISDNWLNKASIRERFLELNFVTFEKESNSLIKLLISCSALELSLKPPFSFNWAKVPLLCSNLLCSSTIIFSAILRHLLVK